MKSEEEGIINKSVGRFIIHRHSYVCSFVRSYVAFFACAKQQNEPFTTIENDDDKSAEKKFFLCVSVCVTNFLNFIKRNSYAKRNAGHSKQNFAKFHIFDLHAKRQTN